MSSLRKGVDDAEVEVQRRADRLHLRQAEAGTPVKALCRKLGISEQTFYLWKKKYAGMGVLELKRVKQVVADLTLDKVMLQDVPSKEF